MIRTEIQQLEQSALVELFVLDSTNLPNGSILRFHAGTNKLSQPVVWQGQTYTPLPIEADGFDVSAKGALPRPKVVVANVGGFISAELSDMDDLVGARVIRKRTFAKYLDAVNFPGGVNPTADANQYLPDDIWYVERKVTEDKKVVEFELSSAFDLMGVQLPNRQVIQNSCPWVYRGPNCGYSGGGYTRDNAPTTANSATDVCNKTLTACRTRFGTSVIRFGGFPGAVRGTGG